MASQIAREVELSAHRSRSLISASPDAQWHAAEPPLGNSRPPRHRFLSWSACSLDFACLGDTLLEEDQPSLPVYVARFSGLWAFFFAQTSQLVIDNRLQQLEPEAIAGIINVSTLNEAPALVVLGDGEIWRRLHGLQRLEAVGMNITVTAT